MNEYALNDLVLAIAHHLLAFALVGVLAFEIVTINDRTGPQQARRVARANVAAKDWDYYATNFFFWAKMGTFILVGLLSIRPTIVVIAWRRALAADAAFVPATGEILSVRRFLWMEAALFALLPAFAAAMARGYGAG